MCNPSIDKQSITDTAHVTFSAQCMRRNIRCGLAYLNYRLNKIERFVWESGKNLPDHILEHMSPAELSYLKKYIVNLENYNKAVSEASIIQDEQIEDDGRDIGNFAPTSIDLTVDFNPPKDIFIEVRVNKDYGVVILPESGVVRLLKNSTHFLRRTEVDHLLKRGILSEVI